MKTFFLLLIVIFCSACNSKKAFLETHDEQTSHASQTTSQIMNLTTKCVDSLSSIRLEKDLNIEETIIEEGIWYDKSGNISFEGQKKIDRHILDLSQRTDTAAVKTLSSDSILTVNSAVVDSVRTENTNTDIKVTKSGTTFSFILGILFVVGMIIVSYVLFRRLK